MRKASARAAATVAQPRMRNLMPETKSMPAKIAAITDVVPRSCPAITRTMTMRKPGASRAKTLTLNLPAPSFLANSRLAQRIIRNFANSLGWISITLRSIQLVFPFTVFPTPGMRRMLREINEMVKAKRANRFHCATVTLVKYAAIGRDTTTKSNWRRKIEVALPFVSMA